jgi:hypothetical protein
VIQKAGLKAGGRTYAREVKRGRRQLVHDADDAARSGEHAEQRVVALFEHLGKGLVQLDDSAGEQRRAREQQADDQYWVIAFGNVLRSGRT